MFRPNANEKAALAAFKKGEVFEASGAARSIRGAFVAALLKEKLSSAPKLADISTGIACRGIRVVGDIDLRNAGRLESDGLPPISFERCEIDGEINLTFASVSALALLETKCRAVNADGIRVSRLLDFTGLKAAPPSHCVISLRGARIGGDLKLSHVVLDLPGSGAAQIAAAADRPRYALAVSEAFIEGRVELIAADIQGGCTFAASQIGQDIVARGLKAGAGDDEVFNLRAAQIGGTVYLDQSSGARPVELYGRFYAPGSTIGGSLRMKGAKITAADRRKTAVELRNTKIAGDCSLELSHVSGKISLMGAAVDHDLVVEFDPSSDVFVDLKQAAVGHLRDKGGLGWGPGVERIELAGIRVNRIMSLPTPKVGFLAGLKLVAARILATVSRWFGGPAKPRGLGHLVNAPGSQIRMEWFRTYVDSHTYQPQPYEEFGRALREQGQPEDARRLFRHRRWQYWHYAETRWTKPMSFLFGQAFGFGYSAPRAMITIAVSVLIGTLGAQFANDTGMLAIDATPVAAYANTGPMSRPVIPLHNGVGQLPCNDAIDPFLYAVDIFIPLLDLRQESKCEAASTPIHVATGKPTSLRIGSQNYGFTVPTDAPSFWARAKSAYALLGWIIMSLSILTFSGLLERRDN